MPAPVFKRPHESWNVFHIVIYPLVVLLYTLVREAIAMSAAKVLRARRKIELPHSPLARDPIH